MQTARALNRGQLRRGLLQLLQRHDAAYSLPCLRLSKTRGGAAAQCPLCPCLWHLFVQFFAEKLISFANGSAQQRRGKNRAKSVV